MTFTVTNKYIFTAKADDTTSFQTVLQTATTEQGISLISLHAD